MAITAAEQRSSYPLAAYNFRVSIDGETVGFSEMSGLKIEHETTTYRHGLSFAEGENIVRHELSKYVPITFKRGIVPNGQTLSAWLASGETRTLDVSLCDETGAVAVTWHIGKAVPVKLEAPAMNAGSSDVAIETLGIMGCRITLEYH